MKRSWSGRADAVVWREIGLDAEECVEGEKERQRAYVFPSVPGAKPVSYPPVYVRTHLELQYTVFYSKRNCAMSRLGISACLHFAFEATDSCALES